MSRHSHWAKIKHDKLAADKKRGILFSKLIKTIQVAAREGADPAINFKLRMAIDQAKAAGMPKETIERAIARGSGQDKEGVQVFEDTCEGFGPGKVAIIVEIVTDNKNRAIQNLKHLFSKFGGTLASPGSVSWQFERKGVLRLPSFKTLEEIIKKQREEVELCLIEVGAEDLIEEDEGVSMIVKPEELKISEERIRGLGIIPDYVGLAWIPKERIKLTPENRAQLEALEEALDETEDVKNYFTNAIDD
jgi:YebC/PmpR family DNA-binding regulatory protein